MPLTMNIDNPWLNENKNLLLSGIAMAQIMMKIHSTIDIPILIDGCARAEVSTPQQRVGIDDNIAAGVKQQQHGKHPNDKNTGDPLRCSA